jgi:hypothetical protein
MLNHIDIMERYNSKKMKKWQIANRCTRTSSELLLWHHINMALHFPKSWMKIGKILKTLLSCIYQLLLNIN